MGKSKEIRTVDDVGSNAVLSERVGEELPQQMRQLPSGEPPPARAPLLLRRSGQTETLTFALGSSSPKTSGRKRRAVVLSYSPEGSATSSAGVGLSATRRTAFTIPQDHRRGEGWQDLQVLTPPNSSTVPFGVPSCWGRTRSELGPRGLKRTRLPHDRSGDTAQAKSRSRHGKEREVVEKGERLRSC